MGTSSAARTRSGTSSFASSGACGRCTQGSASRTSRSPSGGGLEPPRRRRRLGPGRGAARRRGARRRPRLEPPAGRGRVLRAEAGVRAPRPAGTRLAIGTVELELVLPARFELGFPMVPAAGTGRCAPPGAGGEPRALPGHPPRAPPGSPPRLARPGAGGGGERRGRRRPCPECAPGAGGGRSARPARRPGRRAVEEGGRRAPARRSRSGCGRSARRGQGSRPPPGGERSAARFPLASLGDELSRALRAPRTG